MHRRLAVRDYLLIYHAFLAHSYHECYLSTVIYEYMHTYTYTCRSTEISSHWARTTDGIQKQICDHVETYTVHAAVLKLQQNLKCFSVHPLYCRSTSIPGRDWLTQRHADWLLYIWCLDRAYDGSGHRDGLHWLVSASKPLIL